MQQEPVNILIIDDLHPDFLSESSRFNWKVDYRPEIRPNEVPAALADADVLVVRSKVRVDAALCKKAGRLKLVARAGSGVDNLDTEFLESSGITYINTPEANSQAVAEHTLGMLLSLIAKITKADSEVRSGLWDREGNRGDELNGKTIGIIGYGHTGSRVARLLSGFDVRIVCYDKYKSGFAEGKVEEFDMDTLFKEADILTLHIPLTGETRQLVDKDYIHRFRKPFRLLNLSRGEIVCTGDVLQALDQGKITGFGADVLENERINQLNNAEQRIFDALISRKDVVLTPHTGGWTIQSYKAISGSLVNKIADFCKHFPGFESGFKEAQKFP